jgi:site-specific recombinase XerC
MLADLVRKSERQQAGIVDRASDELARTITDHLVDYRKHLFAKGRSEKHINDTIRIVEKVTAACRCRILADLQGATDSVEAYLAERLESGASHRTVNADLVAVRSFCRWLLSRKRMHEDPTAGLSRLNEEEDRRRERRALTDDEAQQLIDATDASPRVFRGLTGRDRAVMYLLAQRTGLRRSELLSLRPDSFSLASEPATVVVQAGSSKRRKKDTLPLSKDVADIMAAYLADRDPQAPIWPRSWWRRSADMLRDDLMDAGIKPVDDEGRVVDFHGQRTTFITGLARVGIVPAMAQQLARHSDINLTLGTYTRLTMREMAAAVETLPELRLGGKAAGETPPSASLACEATPADPELRRVVTAWPSLPGHIRQAILALLTAAEPETTT